jgi:transposase-like protein
MCIRMDPQGQFCHNRRCRAYGRSGESHVVIHRQKERRYRCKRCGRTFSESKGTALYRVHKPKWLVLAVVTLLAYGCPVQVIVAAFDLDERTVARWQKESGLFRALGEGDGSSIQSLQTLPGGNVCPTPLPMLPTAPFPDDYLLSGSLSPQTY